MSTSVVPAGMPPAPPSEAPPSTTAGKQGKGAVGFKIDEILSQLSHSGGHDFDLNDPSTINEEEAELIATMRAADVDGDGTISLLELSKMGTALNSANRMQKHYKKIIAAFGFLFVVVCFMLIGLVAAGVQMTKESRVPSGTGSSASVTTSGSALPASASADTKKTKKTDDTTRRLGSSALADSTFTRRVLISAEDACNDMALGLDCKDKKNAKEACGVHFEGNWDPDMWDQDDMCSACTDAKFGSCKPDETPEEKLAREAKETEELANKPQPAQCLPSQVVGQDCSQHGGFWNCKGVSQSFYILILKFFGIFFDPPPHAERSLIVVPFSLFDLVLSSTPFRTGMYGWYISNYGFPAIAC